MSRCLGRGTATFDAVAEQAGGSTPPVATSVAPELPAKIVIMKHFSKYTSRSSYAGQSGTQVRIKNYEAQFAPGADGQWRRSYQATVTDDVSSAGATTHNDYQWSHTNTVGTQHTVSGGVEVTAPMDGTFNNDVLIKYVPDKSLDHQEYLPGHNTPIRYLVTHFRAARVKHRWDYPGGDFNEETLKARTDQKLFTGGKAGVGRRNLLQLDMWAEEYGRPVNCPWTYTSGTVVAGNRIQLLGRSPGSDGKLWLALADNTEHSLNLRVPSAEHINAEVQPQKYKPYITANEVPLDRDKVNVTNCVGQKIVFALQFDPAWPGGAQATNCDWVLSPKYVNAWEEYSGMEWNSYWMHTCHPETNWFSRACDQGAAPETPYCKFYQAVAWPLKQSETGAWWVSGGNKLARLFSELTFANGQKTSLITDGRFQIHRPTFKSFTDVNPYFPNSGRSFLWNGDVLSYGDSGLGEHGLYWQVEVDANFNGDLGILQLVNAQYTQNHGWCPACRDTLDTHGEYWLDGSGENYEQKAYEVENPLTHKILMTDHPAEELWLASPINVRMWGQFKDYLRFRPSGADSIFVTLGKNNWSMEGKATVTSGITINNTPAPSALVESDEFPVWTQIKFE